MKFIYLIISFFIFHCTQLTSLERKEMIVEETVISPEIEDFDCHSSCVIETSHGVLCAVWKGGPGKGKSNIDIKKNVGVWLSRYENGKWIAPKQIVSAPDSVCWNPILAKDPAGKLLLFYRIGIDPRHAVSFLKYSTDGGHNWSNSEILPAGIGGPTKAKPLFDAEGNMICGSSIEVGGPEDDFKATACWIEVFSKSKQQWSRYGPIEIPGKRFGCIEPVLFWSTNGLKMLCRDRSNRVGLDGWIWMAESKDLGRTWSQLEKTTLPNPDSGIEVLSLGNGKTLLFYNNSHVNRYPLSIAMSNDDGLTWTHVMDLETESGEFPSAVLDSRGFVHITYAWAPEKKQRRIKHVILNLNVTVLPVCRLS